MVPFALILITSEPQNKPGFYENEIWSVHTWLWNKDGILDVLPRVTSRYLKQTTYSHVNYLFIWTLVTVHAGSNTCCSLLCRCKNKSQFLLTKLLQYYLCMHVFCLMQNPYREMLYYVAVAKNSGIVSKLKWEIKHVFPPVGMIHQ